MIPASGVSHTGKDAVRHHFLAPLLTPKQLSEAAHSEFALHFNSSADAYTQKFIRSAAGHGDRKVLGGFPAINEETLSKAVTLAGSQRKAWQKLSREDKEYVVSEFVRVCDVHKRQLVDLMIQESGMHFASAESILEMGLETMERAVAKPETAQASSPVMPEVIVSRPGDAAKLWESLSFIMNDRALVVIPPQNQIFLTMGLKLILEYAGVPAGLVTSCVTSDSVHLE
eukprot:CAMPEP_0184489042 /NCGR_PEP_ID=MMETSP0113_2-20130426/14250_1 /TAXON_ID=91329 /ORGANISM="Norrisiella sphaerica, Strain BC52" /LENGTH=227 /DNA_ID=CAMNT_0026872231 /DNA_START=163 /DNA_END=846 /DNA_ORIENTATION=-